MNVDAVCVCAEGDRGDMGDRGDGTGDRGTGGLLYLDC